MTRLTSLLPRSFAISLGLPQAATLCLAMTAVCIPLVAAGPRQVGGSSLTPEQPAALSRVANQAGLRLDSELAYPPAGWHAPLPRSVKPAMLGTMRSLGVCSDFIYTQNTDPDTIESDNSVLCFSGLGAYTHWFGRHHDLSTGATSGQPVLLECVTVAADSNNQDTILTINAYVDDDGVERPDTSNMTYLGTTDLEFLLADGFPQIVTATFDPPLSVPPDSIVFIEMIVPEQRSPDSTPGFFNMGSNSLGQSGPSWIRTEATPCGLTDWATTAEIGYPEMHIVESIGVAINDDFDPCDLPVEDGICSADVASVGGGPPDGTVSLPDFSLLLVEFGTVGDGSFRPTCDIAPLPNGDCRVDTQDFGALLIQWGNVCVFDPTGACCYPSEGVGGDEPGLSCDVVTEAACNTLGGNYLGDDTNCDDNPCFVEEQAWLNELHYDNAGSDTGEFLEIYASDGVDPATVQVYLYNGSNGTVYGGPWSLSSDFVTGDDVGPGSLYHRNHAGIQNGSPDGIAILIDGEVAQFVSYEGTFTASDGPLAGLNSTLISIAQSGGTAPGSSIGLSGSGTGYEDFNWIAFPADATQGALNTGQTILP